MRRQILSILTLCILSGLYFSQVASGQDAPAAGAVSPKVIAAAQMPQLAAGVAGVGNAATRPARPRRFRRKLRCRGPRTRKWTR